jgi:lactate permease
LSGFLAIIWIIIGAIFLYNMTLISGKFEIVKESIIHISFDRRFQVLLIAFSFGAIIEGTSGFGTPVAIAGAVMVGLGFAPFESAVLNLLANTAPVAYSFCFFCSRFLCFPIQTTHDRAAAVLQSAVAARNSG